MRSRTLASLIAVALMAASTSLVPLAPDAESAAPELVLGPRLELKHPGKAHEIHLSGVSVAAAPEGGALVTWGANEGQSNQIYVARLGAETGFCADSGSGGQDRDRSYGANLWL